MNTAGVIERTTASSQGLVVIQVGCKEEALQTVPVISDDLVRGGQKSFYHVQHVQNINSIMREVNFQLL